MYLSQFKFLKNILKDNGTGQVKLEDTFCLRNAEICVNLQFAL